MLIRCVTGAHGGAWAASVPRGRSTRKWLTLEFSAFEGSHISSDPLGSWDTVLGVLCDKPSEVFTGFAVKVLEAAGVLLGPGEHTSC